MTKPKPPTASEIRERFISTALGYVGYETPNGTPVNTFNQRAGLDGKPWNGIFIDVVAGEAGVRLPVAHTVSTVALAHYLGRGFFHVRPRRGDIVFLQTSTASEFGSPHIGIVLDTKRHAIDGIIQTVEGMTASGLPKKAQTPNGVYVRTRHQTEVIGYARPKYKTASPLTPNENAPEVAPAQVRSGIKHKSVVHVQLALSKVTGITGLPRGHFDAKTKLAYAKFQRDIGYVGASASGDADYNSLKLLGELTGFFNAIP
jgi:hypothetical protein